MLRRLHALYLRYVAVRADRLQSVPLGPVWRRVGQVERVDRVGHLLRISGWVDGTDLSVTWPGGEVAGQANIPRSDVALARGLAADTGFEVMVPGDARPMQMRVRDTAGALHAVDVPHPLDAPSPAARRRMMRAFTRDLIRALPAMARHWRNPSEFTRTAVKRALGLEDVSRGHPINRAWLSGEESCDPAPDGVVVIVPVHNAVALTKRCLEAVARHTEGRWAAVVIDDASTDPKVRPWLTDWAAIQGPRVQLQTQDTNLGFVETVNAGLRAAAASYPDWPIVLLNTDAILPPGWAPRLLAPLSDPDVASVTPMSNDAEILSVPAVGKRIDVSDAEIKVIDTCARAFRDAPLPDPLPTGVGFCMALSPHWLARVPQLDTDFGRGYGEEVDWCQRTRKLGAHHVAQPRLFVPHLGGKSFGSAEKADRIRAANTEIARRYPAYDADVQRFMLNDPLATPRLALGIALAGQREADLPVFVAHSLGGGAEAALQVEIAQYDAAIVLRVGGVHRFQLELHMAGGRTAVQTDEVDDLHALLAAALRLHIIYSCGVGDSDPASLPDVMLSLRRADKGDRISARLHDYFMVSPAYTLLGSAGGFTGVPPEQTQDPAHWMVRSDGSVVALAQWRAAWGRFLAAVDEVEVFSQASANLLTEVYPDAPVVLRPHALPTAVRSVRPGTSAIGVLGNLNRQKGVEALTQIAEAAPDQRFVLIGLCDSAYSLPRNVVVHGAYDPVDIADLTEAHDVCAWLMPAIWPETFSFAVHEALATGLPVAGFAIGAQGDALRDAPNGITVPLDPFSDAPARLFAALEAARAETRARNTFPA